MSNYLTNKLNSKIQVKVTNLSLSLPSFEADLLLNDTTKINTKGTINPFAQKFKLNYKLITPNIICKKKTTKRDFYIKGEANGTLDRVHFFGNGKIFSSKHENTLATIQLKDGDINTKLKTVTCNYKFKVSNLAKMTHKRYNGTLDVLGKIIYKKSLHIYGGAENFGGYTGFHYHDDKVNIKLSKTNAQKIEYLLGYPTILDAKVSGDIEYYLTQERANIDLGMKDVVFINCITNQNLYKLLKIDMTKSRFKYGQFIAKSNVNGINIDFKIQNPNSHLYLTNMLINKNRQTINSKFDLKMQHKELSGKLYGDLYKPTIDVNMGDIFVLKVKQVIDIATNFDMKSKFDCIKSVADGLFGGLF